ncbi:TPA: hypothetical protein OMU21_004982 [Klebsiella aerogenes]|nr:hypothetical protein [Klebsiella aerogenes]
MADVKQAYITLSEEALQHIRVCLVGAMVANAEGNEGEYNASTFGGWTLFRYWLESVAPHLPLKDSDAFRLEMENAFKQAERD